MGEKGEDQAALVKRREDHVVLKGKEEGHEVLDCFFLPRGLGSRRDFAAIEKGEKGLLLLGHEKVPREGATWLWINWRLQQPHS